MTTAYVDYTYYTSTYLGTSIASTDFARLALRASAMIDKLTYDRAIGETDTDVIDLIKMATCAVAEELQTQETNSNLDGITSERVGNYSVAFGANARSARTNEEKQAQAAKLYLWNTGLMYRSFAEGEYAG